MLLPSELLVLKKVEEYDDPSPIPFHAFQKVASTLAISRERVQQLWAGEYGISDEQIDVIIFFALDRVDYLRQTEFTFCSCLDSHPLRQEFELNRDDLIVWFPTFALIVYSDGGYTPIPFS